MDCDIHHQVDAASSSLPRYGMRLKRSIYLISYAWDQLLAGDVEDLVEFADLELENR